MRVREKGGVSYDLERDEGGRRGEWSAAEGRAMAPRGKGFGERLARKHRRHGKSRPQSLGAREDVGGEAVSFVCPQGSRPADARLHLVDDHGNPVRAHAREQGLHPSRIRGVNSALPLDELQDHRIRPFRDDLLKCIQIIIGRKRTFDQRGV